MLCHYFLLVLADKERGLEDKGLRLSFCGEVHCVAAGETLTFGRHGDLSIDDNHHLHRHLGLLRYSQSGWWLDNVGSVIGIEIADKHSPSRMQVAPGGSVPLGFAESVLRFQAGRSTYEIDVTVPVPVPPPHAPLDGPTSTVTVTAKKLGIELTETQLQCIVALAKNRLEDPSAPRIVPTNREAAQVLGWRITRFNRKLDNVCDRLSTAGVGGLRGSSTTLAKDRRNRLVDYAITSGLVTADSLALLPQSPN